MKRLIVVTGTPGVGKTSVSRLLACRIDAKLIQLGDLIEKEKLYEVVDRKRGTLVADMEKISERVRGITTASEGDVVIEGHFAVDVVPPERINQVFVLRRDPRELREILLKRGYREEKIRENLAAEILDVCLYDAVKRCGADGVCEVEVTGREVEEVVEEILLVIDRRKKCTVGIVDWLGKLESEGKLDEYLRDF